jgi:pyruvate/2-oxoglutarate/acetoin dehydrogenase E1 component
MGRQAAESGRVIWAKTATSTLEGTLLSLRAPIARVTRHDVPFVGLARKQGSFPDVARAPAAAREALAF